MKKHIIRNCICILVLCSGLVNVRGQKYSWADTSAVSTINLFCEPGFISAMGGVGNIEPLIFEANIIPYYTLGLKTASRWGVLLSPQVILRMYNKASYPVRTPSYMPRITFMRQFLNHKKQRDWFYYASWFHHSNGQDGTFYLPNTTTVNTYDGSFSTNWIETGFFLSRPKKDRKHFSKLSAKYCYSMDEHLDGIYGRLRFNWDFLTEIDISKVITFLSASYLETHKVLVTHRLNLGYIADDLNGTSYYDLKRLMFRYTFTYKPSIFKDVKLFAQYYYGEDYYNIYFNRTLNVLRFGIVAKTSIFD